MPSKSSAARSTHICNLNHLFFMLGMVLLILLSACSSGVPSTESPENGNTEPTRQTAEQIVANLTVREKIGQKLMMAIRYWCPVDQPDCTTGMTDLPDTAAKALRDNGIGGVILFSDNLVGTDQIQRLTTQFKNVVPPNYPVGMLIGTDEEGGNVFRLPRVEATSFSGNMALGAAYLASGNAQFAYEQGRVMAAEIAAVGFNVNFAPVVDVNSNPLNPVINVRSYGDDPAMIGLLGRRSIQGMASQGVLGTFKHFPGHGDTATDSHFGLPIVTKSRADAYAIDLAPYRQAIQAGQAPDLIMTAHIQYPALDNSVTRTRTGEQMISPATMSRTIQHEILRNELGYRGVTITDALDMQGIAGFFEQSDAVIKVFQADVDIALMPVEIRNAAQVNRLSELIDQVAAAINAGQINRAEFDRSVTRIVQMKLRHGVTPAGANKPISYAPIGNPEHRAVERAIAQNSITLLRNTNRTLPLQAHGKKIFILTPWCEQAEAMRLRFAELGYPLVTGAKFSDLTVEDLTVRIDAADIVIIGTMSTGVTPVERNGDPNNSVQIMRQQPEIFPSTIRPGRFTNSLVFNVLEDQPASDNLAVNMLTAVPNEAQQMRDAMVYAKSSQKKVIHVTLRAPYDIINYDDLADATLASYAYYGYEAGLRGPSLPVLVDVMLNVQRPVGKLPFNVFALNADGALGLLRYPRGFGLQY